MNGALIRNNGLGGTEYGAVAAVRRTVEPEHLRFVAANRHRLGWQTMAKICGVNEIDLRRACESEAAGRVSVAVTAAVAPAPKPVKILAACDATTMIKVLWAVAAGAVRAPDLAEACGLGGGAASQCVYRLKRAGLLAGDGWVGWWITHAGWKALREAGYDG